MNIIKLLSLAFTFLVFQPAYGCVCPKQTLAELVREAYLYSDVIFIGDVAEWDSKTDTYEVEVVELFKGEVETRKIKGRGRANHSCSKIPDLGRWIIYGIIHEGYLYISECSPSRSFDKPFFTPAAEYKLPPLPKNLDLEKAEDNIEWGFLFERKLLKLKKRALNDLEKEIINLRKKRSIPNTG